MRHRKCILTLASRLSVPKRKFRKIVSFRTFLFPLPFKNVSLDVDVPEYKSTKSTCEGNDEREGLMREML